VLSICLPWAFLNRKWAMFKFEFKHSLKITEFESNQQTNQNIDFLSTDWSKRKTQP
jgi:hypothetical protein